MEQHPIPQQITSYEFKLVGDMTLKQFGKAAGGIVIALLINSSKLVFFIKWPLMIVFAAGGLALAFVPFQDRPLETWLMAFIKSIYSPTIYTYKKESPENWLEIDLSKQLKSDEEEEVVIPIKEDKKVKEFINSLPSIGRENQVIMPPEVGTDLVNKEEKENEESLPPEADQPLAEKPKEEEAEETRNEILDSREKEVLETAMEAQTEEKTEETKPQVLFKPEVEESPEEALQKRIAQMEIEENKNENEQIYEQISFKEDIQKFFEKVHIFQQELQSFYQAIER